MNKLLYFYANIIYSQRSRYIVKLILFHVLNKLICILIGYSNIPQRDHMIYFQASYININYFINTIVASQK